MAILPQIEAAYSERNARLHTMYIVLIVVILLFFVSAVAAGLYVAVPQPEALRRAANPPRVER